MALVWTGYAFTDTAAPSAGTDQTVGAFTGALLFDLGAGGLIYSCQSAGVGTAVWLVVGTSVPGGGVTVVTKTTTYTAVAGEFVEADATAAAFSVLMPAAPATGNVVEVIKVDSTSNVVTLDGNGNNISGSSTALILLQYDALTVVYGSSEWLVS